MNFERSHVFRRWGKNDFRNLVGARAGQLRGQTLRIRSRHASCSSRTQELATRAEGTDTFFFTSVSFGGMSLFRLSIVTPAAQALSTSMISAGSIAVMVIPVHLQSQCRHALRPARAWESRCAELFRRRSRPRDSRAVRARIALAIDCEAVPGLEPVAISTPKLSRARSAASSFPRQIGIAVSPMLHLERVVLQQPFV